MTLRDYTVEALLGRGGFGATYRARRGEQLFALKEYLPAEFGRRQPDGSVVPCADAAPAYRWGLRRFVEEARLLSSVDHPNVVRIEEAWEARGTAYIAMEYLGGESLRAAFSRGVRWSESDALAFLKVVCSALAAVHARDIIHRDVTPANVVCREDGSLVLIDFGSARLALGDRSRTVTSLVTAPYAPIEQYSGRAVHGPYTDIYAVAAIAYEGLTGACLADAATRVQDPGIRELVARLGAVAPGLVAVVVQALAVLPERRFPSVEAWSSRFPAVTRSPCPVSDALSDRPPASSVPPVGPSASRFTGGLGSRCRRASSAAVGFIRSFLREEPAVVLCLVFLVSLFVGLPVYYALRSPADDESPPRELSPVGSGRSYAPSSGDVRPPRPGAFGVGSESSVSSLGALARWDDNGNGRIICAEARRHGIAPVPRGHPAYPYMRDGDGDGVVCE